MCEVFVYVQCTMPHIACMSMCMFSLRSTGGSVCFANVCVFGRMGMICCSWAVLLGDAVRPRMDERIVLWDIVLGLPSISSSSSSAHVGIEIRVVATTTTRPLDEMMFATMSMVDVVSDRTNGNRTADVRCITSALWCIHRWLWIYVNGGTGGRDKRTERTERTRTDGRTDSRQIYDIHTLQLEMKANVVVRAAGLMRVRR